MEGKKMEVKSEVGRLFRKILIGLWWSRGNGNGKCVIDEDGNGEKLNKRFICNCFSLKKIC